MIKENRKLVEEYLIRYNNMDIDAMLELFTEDAKFESVSNTSGVTKTENKKELRQLASMSVEYFEERKQTAVTWVISDNHVALEIDYWCRLAKDLPDGKKAGEEMNLKGASFFTIQNGCISKLVDYM
ncbi:MAG: nuclear transport factor 2 family protein [Desulfobacteraceae bacterium]|nr:nuclear transport factor 2 family protein [Desulfobacteraceae bacterium]